MFAQGFVHAQDRFFEMDFRRHVTAGRLSEIFGPDTLETDRFIRTMGWRRVAEREWALLEPATRDALTSYAAGVNAYIADRSPSQLAAEYSVLGLTGLDYSPAEWDPIDSLAWLKAMAWDLRGNMDAEVDRVLLSLDRTEDEIASLWPAYPFDEHPPIVSGGGVVDGVFEQNASGNATREPPPAGVRARRRRRPRAGARPARRDARAHRQGPRDRQQLVGRRRGAQRHRQADPGQRPPPRHQPARHLDADGPALPRADGRLHARHVGLHVLRRARRDHRPQRRHRLGLHQPRPRRHRPLPRADRGRRPLRPRRRDRGDGGAHRDDQGARRGRRRAARARDGPRAADQRRVDGVRDRRRQRTHRRAGRAGERLRRRAGMDRPRAGADRRRDPRPQPRLRLGLVPCRRRRLLRARAEPRLRRPRGPHRLPVARPDPDPPGRQRRHHARGGLDQRQRLDRRVHPLRRAARACSTRRRASS